MRAMTGFDFPVRAAILYLLVLVLVPVLLRAQEHPSIHMLELEAHRGVVVDYSRADSIAATLPVPLPRAIGPTREIVGYLPYWQYDSYPTLDYNLLTQINYFSAGLDGSGNITNDHNWPRTELIEFAHARGVKVKLCATLFGSSTLTTLLGNAINRERAIDNLLAAVQAGGADGIDIDFEGMPTAMRDSMVVFMQTLADTFHARLPEAIITVATPAVDWNSAWDYYALAQIVDGIFIMAYDYSWKGSSTAGPVSPLAGGSINVTSTVMDYLTATGGDANKIILGVPYYGYDWPVVSDVIHAAATGSAVSRIYTAAADTAATHGHNWDTISSTPWVAYQQDAQWRQLWYDDSLSLAAKYTLALDNNLAGVGMWALGYDGSRPELWAALADHFTTDIPPPRPTALAAFNNGDGTVLISVSGIAEGSYQLFTSTDGVNFSFFHDYQTSDFQVVGLPADSIVYFKVRAVTDAGVGPFSEVLGTVPDTIRSKVLIVNGFDRTTGTVNTFDFLRQHAPSVWRLGLAFDASSNEAVEASLVTLQEYEVVIWISGEEATDNTSFSSTEQTLVATYLTDGGNLLVSGSEIGHDLDEKGTTTDLQFYQNYFKAKYVSDDAAGGGHTIIPVSGSIIDGLGFIGFDDGTHGTYDVDWPDGISPAGGSKLIATYQGVDAARVGGAGIAYEGTFGNSSATSHLVYLAVGFETIYPANVRDLLMERFMNFFRVTSDTGATVKPHYVLNPNYPNPFAEITVIPYQLLIPGHVRLAVYDLRGRLIRTLVSRDQPDAKYTYEFIPVDATGRRLASGIYFITLRVDKGKPATRKMLLRR
ncbi:MAG: T9SS type A sorting domain-containing protein [Fidelibacterota bacterium]|nr:MAG: T9SS type A sorting domain-containing protein [Candidatus Neomarinimicrobiota bacterium]